MHVIIADRVWYIVRGKTILEDISFRIEPGTVNVLVGPNGSGKTSLLKIIAGLAKPTKGTIIVLGVKPWSRGFPREKIGYVTQNPLHQLTEPTVREELVLQAVDEEEAYYWARVMGLHDCLEENPLNLSYGEQKRLLIAAALARKPDILLVDELSVGQDSEGLKTIIKALHRYRGEGGTIITSTHDPDIAYCLKPDYTLQLIKGRLAKKCQGLCQDIFY